MLILSVSCVSNVKNEIVSPDGQNIISVFLNEKGQPFYSIRSYGKQIILPSKLGIDFKNPDLKFDEDLKIVDFSKAVINETYKLPTGKTKIYQNHANAGIIKLKNMDGKLLTLNIRAYDDGVAFNYEISEDEIYSVIAENTEINLSSANSDCWIMDYILSYENYYPKRNLDSISNKKLSYPALINVNQGSWVLITEASVYDQPATHIVKEKTGSTLSVTLPEQFTVEGKYSSPWRTFVIGQNLGTIVESVLVENLNPKTEIEDTSWIDPGIAVFPWWGDYLANSYIDTLKMYVDMADEMNWDWIEFDVSLVGSPDHTSNEWRTTDWLPELTSYAKSKGIKVYGWDEIKILTDEMDYVYGRYCDLGIQGIKIDFIDSDDAYAMRFRERAMSVAAKYKLHVSFHGETMPRGQRRKYPNAMTHEGIKGSEYYTFNNAEAPTPTHNCTVPFTRNVVGSMDYTPVTFTIREENPRTTTYAHELALPIIFESGWVVMADRPKAYLNSPAKPLLQQMKATWDETILIDGYPGEFVCMARRNGNDWYLAAINSSTEREVSVPLDFIKNGSYEITIYNDNKDLPLTDIEIIKEQISSGDTLKVNLLENGGFATIIKDAYDAN